MNNLFVLLACLILSACTLELGSSYDSTIKTLYVDYYQEACDDTSNSLCFRTRVDINDTFEVNKISVSGFEELQWGNRYTLEVEAEKDGDGKDISYRLKEINSTVIFDASKNNFLLTFDMGSGILLDNQNNNWIIAADKTFSCSVADCLLLANSYRDNEKVQLSFSVENNELTLLAVKCQSSPTDFSTVCEGESTEVFNISHYRSDCGLFEPRLCLLYKENADSSKEWNILPFEISGFTAQWGRQYQLDVNIKLEAKDLKSVEFISEDDQAIDRMNESFKVVMRTGSSGLEASANDVIMYDNVEFNCSRYNKCNEIDKAVERASNNQERFLILSAFVEISGDTPVIVIEDLLCDAQSNEFTTTCVSEYDDVYWIE
jgi:hypothetical protein